VVCMNRTTNVHATKAERLSWQVVWASGVLVDMGKLHIQDNPQLPKTAWEVLTVADPLLKCLQEVLASGVGPWD
jgi:hypothetical protein